jgi:outer membrane protein assembly factor BamB
MTKSSRSALVILAALTAALFIGADWPQWRGPNRDGKLAGFTAPATWPQTLTQKWKVTVGQGDSTPALAGDRLYVFSRQGGDEVTLCLDAASGKELWSDKYPAQAVSGASASQHPGPRSSVAVADGKVVTFGVGGILSCLDAANGKVLWRNEEYKAWPQNFPASSPMVVEGLCIAHVGGQRKGTILALDLATGKQKWKWDGDGPGHSSPMMLSADGAKLVVEMTEANVVGLNMADGKLSWTLPFPIQGMGYNAPTPIIDGQTMIYTGQGRGTRAVRIEKQGDGFAPKELWTNSEVSTQFNTPVLKDGYLYGLSDRGAFFCLDAKTGKTAWTWSGTSKMGNYSSMVDAGSVIIALPTTELIAFKPNSEKYEEAGRIKVCDAPTFAFPVISGKNVYVRDRDALVLWSFE